MATKYKVVTNETALNLRAQANTDSEILASIPKGAIVDANFVLPVVEGWTAVSYGEKSGYVSNQYIEKYSGDVPSSGGNATTESERSSSDKLLIAGCVVAAVGAIINILI